MTDQPQKLYEIRNVLIDLTNLNNLQSNDMYASYW